MPARVAGPRFARAGEGGDDPCGKFHNTHAVVGNIGDEQVFPCRIQCQSVWFDESGLRRRPAVATEFAGAVAGQCGDDPGRFDATHAAVQTVGDIDRPGLVNHHAIRLVQQRMDCLATVAGKAAFAGAGDRGDRVGSPIDAADAMIERIGEEQITHDIECEVERIVQQRLRRRAAIAGITRCTRACHGRNDPRRIFACHAVDPTQSRCAPPWLSPPSCQA
jgi:hypothetical protein